MHGYFRKEDFMKKILSLFGILIFSLTVFGCNQVTTPTHTASEVIEELEINYQSGDSAENITQNITLPLASELESNASISWESSNPTVLNNSGVVTRQLEDTSVVLIVNVALGSNSLQKVFNVTVKGTIVYFTVTFDIEDVQTQSSIVSGEQVTHPSDPTLEQYHFIGWVTDITSDSIFDFDTAITEDITLYASFKAIVYVDYTIEIYMENLDDDLYTLYSTENLIEEVGIEVEVDTNFTEFTLNEELSILTDIINSEANTVLKAYFDRKIGSYSIEIYKENLEDDLFTLFTVESDTGKVGKTIELDTYPDGFVLDDEMSTVSGIIQDDLNLVLKGYFLRERGNYTVDIYLESLEDESYVLFSSDDYIEKFGKIVELDSNRPGFILNDELSVTSVTIDLETDVELIGYFDRLDYTLSFYDGGNLYSSESLKYEQLIVTIDDPTKDEYLFLGWSTSPVSDNYYTFGQAITSNVILYAQWEYSSEYTYEGYYEDADGLSGTNLEIFLRTLVNTGFTRTSYGEARYILDETDADPNNSNNVLTIYDRRSVSGVWDSGITWNREHVWPNSRLGIPRVTNYSRNIGSDLHNLRAAIPSTNSSRSNYVFGYNTSGTYYPGEDDKGDVARILFYMYVAYTGMRLTDNVLPVSSTTNYLPAGTEMGILSSLLQWHLEDPVDSFEQNRNEVIFSNQNNRNPFIDHPEFVEKIWGTITLSNDTSIFLNIETNEYLSTNNYIAIPEKLKRSYIC